jgi:ferritin
MISADIEKQLNEQLRMEAESSQYYLAMASWAEGKGYSGTAEFLYMHSEEERAHMMKILRYINERGGTSIVPELSKPATEFDSLQAIFDDLLKHEELITNSINELVYRCLELRDYTTHNFLQWYVAEQIEEDALAITIFDKLNLIGNDKGGLYLFDRDVESIKVQSAANKPV